ncbi:lantibiotic dehydratase family protein [Streptomyces sp. NBC_01278]|uniref:lantibiotic dehydratase n=1 Tax=Streptomyces sp. NBC_01278 TaxID=2903809 RepID=UPI002E30F537|nr:lantibiotic dehydratase [Streptomyces sp. NBC_01278]
MNPRTISGTERVLSASFRLDRVSGLPATALTLSEPVRVQLDRYAAAAAALDVAVTPLTDAIFPLVPLAEQGARRRLLKLRRLAHRGGVPTAADLAFLGDAGVPDAELKRWQSAREELARQLAELEEAIAGCEAATADALRTHLEGGPLALSLPLVSAHLPEKASAAELKPGARTARTLLSYLVRAALKPSPLSRLTTVALHPGPATEPAERSETAVPIGLVHSLFTELAATPRLADAFAYAPACPVPSRPGRTPVVLTSLSDTGGFLWSTERIVDAGLYQAELSELNDAHPASLPPARLARYVRTGLLVPVVPWEQGSRAPLIDLADALLGSAAEDAPALADALMAFETGVRAVAAAGPGDRRRLLPALRAQADRLADLCGAPRWNGQLVHEDASTPDLVGPLPHTVAADLETVASALRPYLIRSHVYDAVLEAFRTRYGAGGRCENAAGFFMELQADSAFKVAFHQARMRDMAPASAQDERAFLPVGRTSAPPSTAVLYQISADSAEAVRDGGYRMVVNQFGSALGGLVTRFGRILGEEAVAEAQMGWLEELFPGCEIRTLSLSGQVNNLQHAGAGYLPELRWPAERQRRRAGSLGFDQLVLRHDAATDTLEFEDTSGRPVAPVYTGIVPSHIATGAARLALAVMDPWLDRSPLTRDNHPFLRAQAYAGGTTETVRTPRETADRVVLRRARWVFPAASFPVPERGEPTAAHLLRVDQWRRYWQLPHEVFFLALGDDPLDANRRKPMWLDLSSPHAVATALPLIAGAHTLRVEEALPGREHAWVAGPDGPRTCEHVSFLAWDRSSGDSR